MRTRLSLRWRLVLIAGLQASGIGVLLIGLLHIENQRNLRGQLDRTLETKCDEVISVLAQTESFFAIQQLFLIETTYRSSRDAYFYQISDAAGGILARSENLGDAVLPRPGAWQDQARIHLASVSHPLSPEQRIRVRSEWVELDRPDEESATMLIQTAGSLLSLETAINRVLRRDLFVSACALAAVWSLLWFVISRALQPVAAMTRKASEITAKNLHDRLPITGTGDELDELARVLNGTLDRLAASLRQTEAFSSDASHQIRTRLTRIRGELDLVLRTPASDPVRREIEVMRAELDELSRLCARLLFLARLDRHLGEGRAGENESIRFDESIDLNALLSELVEQATPMARESGVDLRLVETPTIVRGNRSLLVEALLNLLDNAIRFSGMNRGPVAVSIDHTRTEAWVSIADSGPGVAPNERERIFERFYQGKKSPRGTGYGLGLAIVRSIAEIHRGRVEVAETPSEWGGSVFRLVLPVAGPWAMAEG